MRSPTPLRTLALALVGAAAMALAACTQTNPQTGERETNRLGTGALLGVLGGAAAGALSGGDDANDRRQRALIGAGAGGLVGGAIGAYMDNQERQLRQQLQDTDVEVRRTGDTLIVDVPQGVSFDFDSAELRPEGRDALRQVAGVLVNNPRTTIDVVGHTDSIGRPDYNQRLSERRAGAVADYLTAQRVQPARILVAGRGATQPIATNATEEGRARNRRVEIQINPLREPGV
ncbi:OmpA family protein [Novispirillum sp. DQ9]|uniref:OmpA family protein n=1 Tax=Novispirillum sp. DQ9 TaxID=3398612 RepID=UPI003C7A4C32